MILRQTIERKRTIHLTGKEILLKVFDFVEKNDKVGFNNFMETLTEKERNEYETYLSEYKDFFTLE